MFSYRCCELLLVVKYLLLLLMPIQVLLLLLPLFLPLRGCGKT
jgi:hypothetical protein